MLKSIARQTNKMAKMCQKGKVIPALTEIVALWHTVFAAELVKDYFRTLPTASSNNFTAFAW